MKQTSMGNHHLVEFYDCCSKLINDRGFIRQAMIEAATLAKATIVTDIFHEFNPQGISGVVVIAESHLAIHTWPEHNSVAIDIFTCSDHMIPEAAIEFLKRAFEAQHISTQKIERGKSHQDTTARMEV